MFNYRFRKENVFVLGAILAMIGCTCRPSHPSTSIPTTEASETGVIVCTVKKLMPPDVTYISRDEGGTFLRLTIANHTSKDLYACNAVEFEYYFDAKNAAGTEVAPLDTHSVSMSTNVVLRHSKYTDEIPLSDWLRLTADAQYTVRVGWRYQAEGSNVKQVVWSNAISFKAD